MPGRIGALLFWLAFFLLAVLIAWPANAWFSLTMPRHQALQLPIMAGMGALAATRFKTLTIRGLSLQLSLLIGMLASLTFWMLPRSIDLAVVFPSFNRLMLANMLVVGFFCVVVFRALAWEIRILFQGMVAAMLLATGFALRAITVLLCSAYSVSQQHETGLALAAYGAAIFLTTVVSVFRGLGTRNAEAKRENAGEKTRALNFSAGSEQAESGGTKDEQGG